MKDFRAISENLFVLARNIDVGVGDGTACVLSPGRPEDRFLTMHLNPVFVTFP